MPTFTVPASYGTLREFNQCHNPSGSAAGGRFCSGDPFTLTPGQRLATTVTVAPTSFDLHQVKNRRFLFHVPSQTLVLGGPSPDLDSHAVDFDHAKRVLGVPGRFDEYIRGWLGTNRSTYKDGVIHFAPGLRFDAARRFPEYADRFMQTIEYFLRHGGSGKTVVRGFDIGEASEEWKVKDKLPSFVQQPTRPTRRKRLREFNQCHNPAGPGGGQFCSGTGKVPSIGRFARPEGSVRIPDYLKADVERAARAGIVTYHHQQPEPVMDKHGNIHDPVALSHADPRSQEFRDVKTGFTSRPQTGKIRIVTRGGEFVPDEEVWNDKYGFNTTRRKKALTPEMLTTPATEEDVLSTYRHEVGHLMDPFIDKPSRGSTPAVLGKEIRAWIYAVEASPDHRVSQRMMKAGLDSHAYYEFRRQFYLTQAKEFRISRYDQDEWAARQVEFEVKQKTVDPDTLAKSQRWAARAMRAINNYGAVLRKKGVGVREPKYKGRPDWAWKYVDRRTVVPGPGRGTI